MEGRKYWARRMGSAGAVVRELLADWPDALEHAKHKIAAKLADALVPYVVRERENVGDVRLSLRVVICSEERASDGDEPVIVFTEAEHAALKKRLGDLEALARSLVSTINATGGLTAKDGPVADPEWLDLADVYLQACSLIGEEPTQEEDEDEDDDT